MESDVHVEFFGRRLVWLKKPDGSGPLAYPAQYDEAAGELKRKAALSGMSYAQVGADGKIRRFKEVIGTVADLVIVRP